MDNTEQEGVISMMKIISEVEEADTKTTAQVETDKTEEVDTKTTPEVIKFTQKPVVVMLKILLKTLVTDRISL